MAFCGWTNALDKKKTRTVTVLRRPWILPPLLFALKIADQTFDRIQILKKDNKDSALTTWPSVDVDILGRQWNLLQQPFGLTTTPLVDYDELMMTDSNLPEDSSQVIVHKHRTIATVLTALIPFCLTTFPQSLVLCL